MVYKCGQCARVIELNANDPVRCPYCGYKIIFKTRSKTIKKVKPR